MNLRKLPPSMLLALGLGCSPNEGTPNETTLDSCLSTTAWEVTSGTSHGSATSQGPGSATSTSTTGRTTGTSEVDASACLDVGPCLFDIGSPPDMGPETSTGPDTGTSTDSGTGTGTGTGTSGGMLDEPSDTRAAAVQRVLSRDILPADVLERLRALASGAKG